MNLKHMIMTALGNLPRHFVSELGALFTVQGQEFEKGQDLCAQINRISTHAHYATAFHRVAR